MTFLQNKHRNEEGSSFNHYLTHLSEVYKACANSDDPDCIAESTSKPKAKLVMPVPFKEAKVLVCNPYIDPYCIFPAPPKAPEAEPEAAPAKVPAPYLSPYMSPMLPYPYKAPMHPVPMKTPGGIFYYAPPVEPFLSKEQKGELLRICNPSDVECLQYHLRAAYGYNPIGPVPSYSELGCDPAKDPYCWPRLVQKAPSGLYHLYPVCDPATDPFCAIPAAPPAALTDSEKPSSEQACHPLFDQGCNPLTASKLASPNKPVMEYMPQDEPSPAHKPVVCNRRLDPFCILAAAAALKRPPPPPLPQFQTRHRLGTRGRTKEGHDCFMFYDKDCTPLTSADKDAKPKDDCHPYDPSCGRSGAQPSTGGKAASGKAKDGIIMPDPDCDPEMDYNCRLRRAEEPNDDPAQKEEAPADAPADAPAAPEHAMPRFEDFLRGYMGHHRN